MRAQRMYLELVIVILLMVLAVPFIPMLSSVCRAPSVRDYEDKTTLTAQNAIEIDDSLYRYDADTGKYYQCYDGATIAMMLLIQDEYSQDPNKVRISGYVPGLTSTDHYYTFNAAWPGDKYAIINSTYNTYLEPYVDRMTYRFEYMYPNAAPGVTDSYFWYYFR